MRGAGDLGDQAIDLLHRADHVGHGLSGAVHQLAAVHDLGRRFVDQHLDLLGGGQRALRQVAHLAGDHRKAATLFTRACRFHRRVEGQDVGLEGDAVDHADDLADATRRFADVVHGGDHLGHGGVALPGHRGRAL
ncbi:hypothetical protein D9M68_855410 [compost metagenome]